MGQFVCPSICLIRKQIRICEEHLHYGASYKEIDLKCSFFEICTSTVKA